MSRNRDFNFTVPRTVVTRDVILPPPVAPRSTGRSVCSITDGRYGQDLTIHCRTDPLLELKCTPSHLSSAQGRGVPYTCTISTPSTITTTSISSGVQESVIRGSSSSRITSSDWLGTGSSFIHSSTSSTVSSVVPKLSVLHISPSAGASSTGSSVNLTPPRSTVTTTTEIHSGPVPLRFPGIPTEEFDRWKEQVKFHPSLKFSCEPPKPSKSAGPLGIRLKPKLKDFEDSVKKDLSSYMSDTKENLFCPGTTGAKSTKNEKGEVVVIKALREVYEAIPDGSTKHNFLKHLKTLYIRFIDLTSNDIPNLKFMSYVNLDLDYISFLGSGLNDEVLDPLLDFLVNPKPYAYSGTSGLLETTHNINALNLSGNQISDKGAAKISYILNENKFFRYLNLSDNKITDQGFDLIARALKTSSKMGAVTIKKATFSTVKLLKQSFENFVNHAKEQGIVKTDYVLTNKTMIDFIKDGYIIGRNIGWGYIKCKSTIGYLVDGISGEDVMFEAGAVALAIYAPQLLPVYEVVGRITCIQDVMLESMLTHSGVDFAMKTVDLLGKLEQYESSDVDFGGKGCELM